ncbi:uncharacterized protein LOC131658910 [Vicia villosa]|uniref:uncharacterized protein LOC131658910 n=1 Tax=Vicia villosa TaxID=3911 RepID=UPI00273BE7A6|nr:uncharacterized protein LOC131658910 [Vicia villosa]
MVTKTSSAKRHIDDLAETFKFVRSFDMRLNPEKCTFRVQAGKFLSFMLTSRGIEANPHKCQAIPDMRSPSSKIEVHELTGRLAALSRLLSCEGDKAIHFFMRFWKTKEIEWTLACEEVFLDVKWFLSSPPILTRPGDNSPLVLYLSVTNYAMSSVLVQEGEDGERPVYYISKVLKGAERSGAELVLEGPGDFVLEYSLCFKFQASNNQDEYEAPIAGIALVEEVGVTHLVLKTDSQLVASQVKGEYQEKDISLQKYMIKTHELAQGFSEFEIIHIPREENIRDDVLARLASTKGPGLNKTVIQETLESPCIESEEVMPIEHQTGWMTPIIQYLTSGVLPSDPDQAVKVRKIVVRYTRVGRKLYKMRRSTSLLRCVPETDVRVVMMEVHEGACGSHIAGRALAGKILREGYYRPTLRQDYSDFWGADMLGPFPIAPGQLKFVIVVVDYFTKWIEAKAVARISAEKVRRFYRRNIICRFGLPGIIVTATRPNLQALQWLISTKASGFIIGSLQWNILKPTAKPKLLLK